MGFGVIRVLGLGIEGFGLRDLWFRLGGYNWGYISHLSPRPVTITGQ